MVHTTPRQNEVARIRRGFVAALALALVGMSVPAGAGTGSDGSKPNPEVEGFARERGIEIADARQRLEWQKRAPALRDRAEQELGESFGGVWIDPSDGDRVKIGVARPGEAERQKAREGARIAGLEEATDLVDVQHSMATLVSASDWLGAEVARANRGASRMLAAGIRPDVNAVEMAVPSDGLSEAQSALVSGAQKRLGPALVIAPTKETIAPYGCSYPYCDPPLRGGIRTWRDKGGGCTGGFIAKSKVDDKLYQFTAGHCTAGGYFDQWFTYFTDSSFHWIGGEHNGYWGPQGDMGILTINNVPGWNPKAWVYVTSGPDTTTDTTYHISSDSTSVVGMRICSTGASYGRSDCGEVTHLGVTLTYGGVTVHNLGKSNSCGKEGDSGAPMYSFHVAYGLLVAGPEGGGCGIYYQGIHAAENMMNVNVLHTNS